MTARSGTLAGVSQFVFVVACWATSAVAAAGDNPDQCERLFTEPAEIQTCESITQLKGPMPDSEIQGLVNENAHGLSTEEADERRKKEEAEKRKAEAEFRAQRETGRCGRIYRNDFEWAVCTWYIETTPERTTDDELRASVGKVLADMRIDKALFDSVTESALRLIDDEKTDQAIQKEIDARNARAARAHAVVEKRAARKLDAELARGDVGFVYRGAELGGFGTVLVAHFWLQNNTKLPRKDFVIACETEGESGTTLGRLRKTLYQQLNPRQRSSFELNMGFVNSQSARASCRIIGWK